MKKHLAAGIAAALTTAGLLQTPAQAAPTAAPTDPAPVSAGSTWIGDQLQDGLLPGQFGPEYPDYGLTIDAALALVEVGQNQVAVELIGDAIAANVDQYASYAFQDTGENPQDPEPEYYGDVAGATAKSILLAEAVQADPTTFGGKDLVAQLESLVSTAPGTEGRIFDTDENGAQYAYANSIGQGFAVRALDAVGSTKVDAATDYLLAQQCDDGYFRLTFEAFDSVDQACTTDGQPDTDVTALAVLNLLSRDDDTDVQAALAGAGAWLESTQDADGSWGGGPGTEAPNANSTGLAGWALAELGNTAAAERAATWVRGAQADEPSGCTTAISGETGAIAYDPAARSAARGNGIGSNGDQWRRATAQALPVLQWAPATGTGPVASWTTDGYRRAGTLARVGVDGQAPGDVVCFRRGSSRTLVDVGRNGQALASVRLPSTTGAASWTVRDGSGVTATRTFEVLAAKRFPTSVRATIRRGKNQLVRVTGLAAGESVTVVDNARTIANGKANASGVYAKYYRVNGVGAHRVRVTGQFGSRFGTASYRTIR